MATRGWCECGHRVAPYGPASAPRCYACESELRRDIELDRGGWD
jgi:hypothetical protein